MALRLALRALLLAVVFLLTATTEHNANGVSALREDGALPRFPTSSPRIAVRQTDGGSIYKFIQLVSDVLAADATGPPEKMHTTEEINDISLKLNDGEGTKLNTEAVQKLTMSLELMSVGGNPALDDSQKRDLYMKILYVQSNKGFSDEALKYLAQGLSTVFSFSAQLQKPLDLQDPDRQKRLAEILGIGYLESLSLLGMAQFVQVFAAFPELVDVNLLQKLADVFVDTSGNGLSSDDQLSRVVEIMTAGLKGSLGEQDLQALAPILALSPDPTKSLGTADDIAQKLKVSLTATDAPAFDDILELMSVLSEKIFSDPTQAYKPDEVQKAVQEYVINRSANSPGYTLTADDISKITILMSVLQVGDSQVLADQGQKQEMIALILQTLAPEQYDDKALSNLVPTLVQTLAMTSKYLESTIGGGQLSALKPDSNPAQNLVALLSGGAQVKANARRRNLSPRQSVFSSQAYLRTLSGVQITALEQILVSFPDLKDANIMLQIADFVAAVWPQGITDEKQAYQLVALIGKGRGKEIGADDQGIEVLSSILSTGTSPVFDQGKIAELIRSNLNSQTPAPAPVPVPVPVPVPNPNPNPSPTPGPSPNPSPNPISNPQPNPQLPACPSNSLPGSTDPNTGCICPSGQRGSLSCASYDVSTGCGAGGIPAASNTSVSTARMGLTTINMTGVDTSVRFTISVPMISGRQYTRVGITGPYSGTLTSDCLAGAAFSSFATVAASAGCVENWNVTVDFTKLRSCGFDVSKFNNLASGQQLFDGNIRLEWTEPVAVGTGAYIQLVPRTVNVDYPVRIAFESRYVVPMTVNDVTVYARQQIDFAITGQNIIKDPGLNGNGMPNATITYTVQFPYAVTSWDNVAPADNTNPIGVSITPMTQAKICNNSTDYSVSDTATTATCRKGDNTLLFTTQANSVRACKFDNYGYTLRFSVFCGRGIAVPDCPLAAADTSGRVTFTIISENFCTDRAETDSINNVINITSFRAVAVTDYSTQQNAWRWNDNIFLRMDFSGLPLRTCRLTKLERFYQASTINSVSTWTPVGSPGTVNPTNGNNTTPISLTGFSDTGAVPTTNLGAASNLGNLGLQGDGKQYRFVLLLNDALLGQIQGQSNSSPARGADWFLKLRATIDVTYDRPLSGRRRRRQASSALGGTGVKESETFQISAAEDTAAQEYPNSGVRSACIGQPLLYVALALLSATLLL